MAIGTLPPVIGEVPVSTGQPGRQSLRPERDLSTRPGADASARATAASATLPQTGALEEAVAAALGRQDGLAPVFAAGAALAGTTVPSPLIARALEALAALVLAGAPDAAALRRAVEASGLFHESRLAAGVPAGDLKAVLLMLQGLLAGASAAGGPVAEADPGRKFAPAPPRRGARPVGQGAVPVPDGPPEHLPGHLAEAVDRALSRILLHQAASLPDPETAPAVDTDAPPGLVFELPIAGPSGVSIAGIRIERDPPGREHRPGEPGASDPVFRVELAFAVAPLGPLVARVGLLPGRRVVVGLWCADAGAADRIGAERPALEAALAAGGLEVGGVDLHVGSPPERRPVPGHAPPHRLDVQL